MKDDDGPVVPAQLVRHLEALTRASADTQRAAVGARERLSLVEACRVAVDAVDSPGAAALIRSLADPPTQRIVQARFEQDGLECARDAARTLHREAEQRAAALRLEAEEMEALRLAVAGQVTGVPER